MINALLTGIFNVIISLVDVIMSPIDALITSGLPDVANAISSIASLFELITKSLGWGISLLGLSSTCLSIIVMYYVFKLTMPLAFSLIKSALAWYNKLKP